MSPTARRRCQGFLIALALTACVGARAAPASAELEVVIPALHASAREHAAYFPQVLKLALDKTVASHGPYRIRTFEQALTSPRQATELRLNGAINVMWDGYDRVREAELLPIRISLLRQLNDYRVFLIRDGEQARFSAIRSVADLRKLKAGAGVNWPSTAILRANDLPVVTAISYEFLFPMLEVRRFDYMPRGIYEAWYEQQTHAAKGLVIEQTLFLRYPVPFYFFVSRDNPALAQRIERGLRIALKDGSFDKLFYSFPAFKRSLDEIRANKRRILELKSEIAHSAHD